MPIFIERAEKINDDNGQINNIKFSISGKADVLSNGKVTLDVSVIAKTKEDVSRLWDLFKLQNRISVSSNGLDFNVVTDRFGVESFGSPCKVDIYATGSMSGADK